MTPPPIYKPITPNDLAHQYHGRPYGELILHHVERQSLQQVEEGLLRTIEFLPNVLLRASQNWIDLNNSYALREEFWKSDCGDVLLSIVNRAKAFSASHGINADDDWLLNLFDIVVLTFAYTAHSEIAQKSLFSGRLELRTRIPGFFIGFFRIFG
jgi:hypothetical protein